MNWTTLLIAWPIASVVLAPLVGRRLRAKASEDDARQRADVDTLIPAPPPYGVGSGLGTERIVEPAPVINSEGRY